MKTKFSEPLAQIARLFRKNKSKIIIVFCGSTFLRGFFKVTHWRDLLELCLGLGFLIFVVTVISVNRKSFTSAMQRFPEFLQTILSGNALPRFWDMFGIIFGHEVRNRIYQPSVEEMNEDLFLFRRRRLSTGARIWMVFCFTVRTIAIVVECVRIRLLKPFIALIPAKWRGWWNLFS